MSAVGSASMSARSCSNLPPRMPLPTMLRKASTRVFDRSMTRCLKSSKLRQPAHAGVGHRRDADAQREAVGVDAVVAGVGAALARAGEDVGVDVDEAGRHVQARRHRSSSARRRDSIFASTAAIFPSAMATSRTALILLRGSMTCPPRSSRSYFFCCAGGAGGCAEPGSPWTDDPASTCARRPVSQPTASTRQPQISHQPLRAARRVAVHVAPRYSPMSRVPAI